MQMYPLKLTNSTFAQKIAGTFITPLKVNFLQAFQEGMQVIMGPFPEFFGFHRIESLQYLLFLFRGEVHLGHLKQDLFLLFDVLAQHRGIVRRVPGNLGPGIRVTRVVTLHALGQTGQESAQPVVLMEHYPDWPTLSGDSSHLQQREEDLLLFTVVAFVGKEAKEAEDLEQMFRIRLLPRLDFTAHRLQDPEHRLDRGMFLLQLFRCNAHGHPLDYLKSVRNVNGSIFHYLQRLFPSCPTSNFQCPFPLRP